MPIGSLTSRLLYHVEKPEVVDCELQALAGCSSAPSAFSGPVKGCDKGSASKEQKLYKITTLLNADGGRVASQQVTR